MNLWSWSLLDFPFYKSVAHSQFLFSRAWTPNTLHLRRYFIVHLWSGFQMAVEKAKPKQLPRPITLGADNVINQSQFRAITYNSLEAREKSRVHVAISFVFDSQFCTQDLYQTLFSCVCVLSKNKSCSYFCWIIRGTNFVILFVYIRKYLLATILFCKFALHILPTQG